MHSAVPAANAAFPSPPPRLSRPRGGGGRPGAAALRWLAAAAAALTLPGPGLAAPAGNTSAAGASGAGVPYMVQRGDTVSAIAEHLDGRGRWGAIQRLNPGLRIHHITPGRVLLLPEARLRAQPTAARVAGLVGGARVDGNAVTDGMELRAGQTLSVDPEGFVTLDLASGARVRIAGGSVVEMSALNRVPVFSAPREVLRLDSGRLETSAPKLRGPAARYEITTPTAVAAVRGTTFRVGAESASMLTEVIEGEVAVAAGAGGTKSGGDGRNTALVQAGYGLRAEAGRPLAAPQLLPAAPDLARLPARYERPVIRMAVAPPPGASGRVRARVALDAAFERVVAEGLYNADAVEFRNLPDGDYNLAVRALTGDGLEGADAQARFTLAARPEPPFTIAPAIGAKARGDQLRFAWTQNAGARGYVLQVARAGAAANDAPAVQRDVAGGTLDLPLPAGAYVWRVATVDADGRRGPYSDAQPFTLAPLPPAGATPESSVQADTLSLRWPAIAGYRYHWQFARDADFAALLGEADATDAGTTLAAPPPGHYFARVQMIDGDGVRGPYGMPQRIEIAPPPPPPPPPAPAPEPPAQIPWWLLPLLLLGFAL